MLLPFAPGITGYCTKENGILSLRLHSSRSLRTTTFTIEDPTTINTIKAGFSPILEDYLGDNLPGFGDTFMEMQSHPISVDGEEREFEIAKGVVVKFCWIPAGEAQLGSPKEERKYMVNRFYDGKNFNSWNNESEFLRGIYKSNGFWMGKYPVTQAQWQSVMGNNPSLFKGANLPIHKVSWNECQEFIKKCKILDLQLPHEDQWEYACRGGKGNKQAFYWGNTLNGNKANCDGFVPYRTKKSNRMGRATEVGSYEKAAPHPWGLCDMIGNVWEWCENFYSEEGTCQLLKVFRGGGWCNPCYCCRAAARCGSYQNCRDDIVGFRLSIS